MMRPRHLALLASVVTACSADSRSPSTSYQLHPRGFYRPSTRVDELPDLITSELPFKYPAPLYARKVQGNVTLRLFIDRNGRVIPDSTRVVEPSGYPLLDSAALRGASDLRFVPAKLHGDPQPISILFPVYFRHPEARPLPGDSILNAGHPG